MTMGRRAEIRKIITKKQTIKIDEIPREELIEYIEETHNMVILVAQNLVSNI